MRSLSCHTNVDAHAHPVISYIANRPGACAHGDYAIRIAQAHAHTIILPYKSSRRMRIPYFALQIVGAQAHTIILP